MTTFVYSDAYIAFIKYINLKLSGDEELKMRSDTQITAPHCYILVPRGEHVGFWDGISCSTKD
jgi:hypothetical protein